MSEPSLVRIGIALGSGSARGWAHIGILRALEAVGIIPDIACGTSIGALVGAAYASNRLDALEEWVLHMDWWEMLRLMDPRPTALIEGERLMKAFSERVEDVLIESLPKPFGAVATDLFTGREIWFQKGSLMEAVRASIALPGLFSPVYQSGRWLVDGGLVDPVPVSLCRAMGAERVIAVNLNGDIIGRYARRRSNRRFRAGDLLGKLGSRLQKALGNGKSSRSKADDTPGLFDVIAGSMHIMQDRITRSRMAGEPPDVLLVPRVAHLALLDFDRAEEAISAGRICVERNLPLLVDALTLNDLDEHHLSLSPLAQRQ
jgi:NTE family protein